jgi:hypothetical protein
MHAKHEGRTWVVRQREHVFGKHRKRDEALEQEGAIHLHIRQAKKRKGRKGGGFLVTVFKTKKSKRKGKRK